jgi:hypothetical protein
MQAHQSGRSRAGFMALKVFFVALPRTTKPNHEREQCSADQGKAMASDSHLSVNEFRAARTEIRDRLALLPRAAAAVLPRMPA